MTTVDSATLDVAAELLDHLNEDYGDSIAFVARVLGQRPATRDAEVVGVDTKGVDVKIGGTGEVVRVPFEHELAGSDELVGQLFGLVAKARQVSGEPGSTAAERAMAEMATIATYVTSVAAVEEVHPHLRCITFAGGLEGFQPAGPDTFLYVLLPPPGRSELTVDTSFSWSAVEQMAPEDRPVGAYYTLRRWRPERGELDMLFVLHGDEGPAAAWAARAKPGDAVALWGPRRAFAPPPGTDWYLLIADDTGLPAVAAILESLPPGTPARVFAEVDNEDERQELPSSPWFDVTWLYRRGAPAAGSNLLVDALQRWPWPAGGTPYAWGGAESRVITAVRRYLRDSVGLAREAVSMTGYWRA